PDIGAERRVLGRSGPDGPGKQPELKVRPNGTYASAYDALCPVALLPVGYCSPVVIFRRPSQLLRCEQPAGAAVGRPGCPKPISLRAVERHRSSDCGISPSTTNLPASRGC